MEEQAKVSFVCGCVLFVIVHLFCMGLSALGCFCQPHDVWNVSVVVGVCGASCCPEEVHIECPALTQFVSVC